MLENLQAPLGNLSNESRRGKFRSARLASRLRLRNLATSCVYVGGVVTNSPDNLIKWILSPQAFSPRSAMPATGITEAEARDIAAYLYSR